VVNFLGREAVIGVVGGLRVDRCLGLEAVQSRRLSGRIESFRRIGSIPRLARLDSAGFRSLAESLATFNVEDAPAAGGDLGGSHDDLFPSVDHQRS
jgi:hypothetical protein